MDEEPSLETSPAELLLAALIAKDYLAHGYSDNKAKLSAHRTLALDWLDWAVCESDLGRLLIEARAQAAKKGGGSIVIGKPE